MTLFAKRQESSRKGALGATGVTGAVRALLRPLAAAGLLAMASTVGADTVKAPYWVSNDCMVCHGMRGGSTTYNVIPRLAGQHKSYIVGELTKFKAQTRRDQNGQLFMWPVAEGLTTAQINEVATYFSSQKPGMQASGVQHAGVAEGKAIFMNGVAATQIPACAECHGANAKGAGIFPQIAGQRYEYIVRQLIYFKNGTRKNQLMNQIVKPITRSQMKAVAAYLASL